MATRERLSKERMIRFVLGPDRRVVPDLAARLPGRGIWLSARADVLEGVRAQARLAGYFARAARGPVVMPPDLVSALKTGLARRIVELLGLARRAGQAIAGFDKGREWVRSGRVGLVVQASDGSAEERARFVPGDAIPVIAPLDAATLGGVFGRERTVHVVIAPGRLADALRAEWARLAGLSGLHVTAMMPEGDDAAMADGAASGDGTTEDEQTPQGARPDEASARKRPPGGATGVRADD